MAVATARVAGLASTTSAASGAAAAVAASERLAATEARPGAVAGNVAHLTALGLLAEQCREIGFLTL